MNDDFDPFATPDGDRTVLRPNPGGRKQDPIGSNANQPAASTYTTSSPPPVSAAAAGQEDYSATPASILDGASINVLIDAAAPILRTGATIRQSLTQGDTESLRRQLLAMIKAYERHGTAAGYDTQTVLTGRYLLCTFIDEAVTSTPWGAEGQWTQQSLLSTCHNETWGGEKFFQIVEMHTRDTSSPDLLELACVCLLLGFEGKYAVMEQGRQRLDQTIDQIYATIQRFRGDIEHDLSPNWRSTIASRQGLIEFVPAWVIAAIAGGILLLTFTAFSLLLQYQTHPVKEQLEGFAIEIERSLEGY